MLDANKFNDESLFRFMKDEEASELTKAIHQVEKDSTVSILKVQKPNIVILLLESWSGDMIESLGGEAGITPEFRKLEKEGLLFTDFYASGNRSQQAMGSLFAGIPGLPITTITNHPEKYASLPSLV
ncbi:MAG: sulfatase-like hydrolase/transferase, partial [Deltaproteobacteria bacterium]|nr:sulfatase-like hydrolase/transferase [Deltaproteobacteria bacterium]